MGCGFAYPLVHKSVFCPIKPESVSKTDFSTRNGPFRPSVVLIGPGHRFIRNLVGVYKSDFDTLPPLRCVENGLLDTRRDPARMAPARMAPARMAPARMRQVSVACPNMRVRRVFGACCMVRVAVLWVLSASGRWKTKPFSTLNLMTCRNTPYWCGKTKNTQDIVDSRLHSRHNAV